MYCGKCGAKQPDDHMNFCCECGEPLSGAENTVPQAAYAAPAPAKPALNKKGLAVTLTVTGVFLVLAAVLYFAVFIPVFKRYLSKSQYADTNAAAKKIYYTLADKMSGGNEMFRRMPDAESLMLFGEIMNGGTYEFGKDGTGVQHVIYETFEYYPDYQEFTAYVGYDVQGRTVFVQCRNETGEYIGQYPGAHSFDERNELTFGVYSSPDNEIESPEQGIQGRRRPDHYGFNNNET